MGSAAATKKYRAAHLEECRERERRWRAANKGKRAAAARRRRAENPDKAKTDAVRNRFRSALIKARHHAKKYGGMSCLATPEDIKAAFTGQCFACCAPETRERPLHMDHNHNTGQFRGWLCSGCNWALGQVGDSTRRLRCLIEYLEKNS